MSKKSAKERFRSRRRRQRIRSYLIWGAVGIVAIGAVAWLVSNARKQASGETVEIPGVEAVPVMSSAAHVPEGTDPGPYNSDPPTSGPMFANQLFAGFYDEDAIQDYGAYPDGFLVHSLEHGYVVFWCNRDLLGDAECGGLKDEIQDVMSSVGNFKVIGFPRPSQNSAVVMTSWGRLLQLDQFDSDLAEQFVRNYRNQAPEANAG